MFARLIFLGIIAVAYGQRNVMEEERLYVPDDRCPPAEQHHLLQHEYDCTKFYYCEYGVRYLEPRNCAPGTEFSFEKQVCIHPAQANCNLPGSSTASPPTAAPTAPPSPSTPAPSPSTAAPTPAPSPSTAAPTPAPSPSTAAPTPPPPVEINRCRDNCQVPHWPHESDCDKFWRCEGNQKVLGVCSEGLYFNSVTRTCDFNCNVNCVRNVVQATAQREGLSVFLPWDKVEKFSELARRGEFPEFL